MWLKFYGGSGEDETKKIISPPDGKYIVLANTTSNNSGDVPATSYAGNNVLVLKIDVNGNVLDKKVFGGPGNDLATNIVATKDGGYIICGNTDQTGGDFTDPHHGSNDMFAIKLNSDLTLQWTKLIGGSKNDYATGVVEDVTSTDPAYVVAGYVNGYTSTDIDGDISPKTSGNDGTNDAYLVKLSDNGTSGEILWNGTFCGSKDDKVIGIKLDPAGKVYVGGDSNSTNGDFQLAGNHGGYDQFVATFDVTQMVVFKPLDVETIDNAGVVKVKNWLKESAPGKNLSNYTCEISSATDTQLYSTHIKTQPIIDAKGDLSFEIEDGFTGTIPFKATLKPVPPLHEPDCEADFNIIIKPYQLLTTLLSETDFNSCVDALLQDISSASSVQIIADKLNAFAQTVEKCPTTELGITSFDRIAAKISQKTLNTTDSALKLNNSDLLLAVNNVGTRIAEHISKVDVPAYYCNGKVGSVVNENNKQLALIAVNGNVMNENRLNQSLKTNKIPVKLETSLMFASKSIWNKNKALMEIPSNIFKNVYERGISNIVMETDSGTLCMKRDTLSELGNTMMFSMFKSLTPENMPKVDLALYVDGVKQGSFDKNVSVQIPFVCPQNIEPDYLTVFKDNGDGTFENKGGIYNATLGRMVFMTQGFSMYIIMNNPVTYSDTTSVPWAAQFIQALASKGVVSGVQAGTYNPTATVKREDFCIMLINAFKLIDSTATSSFSDVLPTDTYYAHVSSAYKARIMSGISATIFGKGGSITREAVATAVTNTLMSTKNLSFSQNPENWIGDFVDRQSISGYATMPVAFVVASNIMQGSAGYFNPQGYITRAEAAVAIYKAMSLNSAQGFPNAIHKDSTADVT